MAIDRAKTLVDRAHLQRLAFVCACSFTSIWALDYTWTGATNTNWSTATNWALSGGGNGVPGTGDNITISSAATITVDSARSINTILINTASDVTITTSGGFALTLDNNGSVTKQGAGIWTQSCSLTGTAGAGTVTVTAGTLKIGVANAIPINLDLVVNGTLDLNGFACGCNSLNGSGAIGNTGATATLTGGRNAAGSGSGTFSGIISGAINFTKNGSGTITLSGLNTYTGKTTISRGTLSANTLADAGSPSSLGQGNLDSVIAMGGATTNGILQYTGPATSTNRNLAMVGSAGNGANINHSGTGLLHFTGTCTVTAAGAKTLALAGSSTFAADIGTLSSSGGVLSVTKTGSGTWILTGANTYTGTTDITVGTLVVTGSTSASSAVTVSGTGILGGTGTVGGTVSISAGALRPGLVSAVGTLTTGAVTMSGTPDFTVDLTGTNVGDQLTTGGAVALAGTMTLRALNAASTTGNVYTIVQAGSGLLTGTFSNYANNATITAFGRIFRVNYTTSAVTLTDTGRSTTQTWDGGGSDNLWSTAANWSGDTVPVTGDDVIFSGSTRLTPDNDFADNTSFNSISFAAGAGNFVLGSSLNRTTVLTGGATAITNNATSGTMTINQPLAFSTAAPTITNTAGGTLKISGTIANGGLLITANVDLATFSGTISGTGGLTKTAANSQLNLTNTHSYTGTTTVSFGRLSIGDGTTDGTISSSSNIVNNATLIFNVVGTVTCASNISGSAGFQKSGVGTLTLSGTNSYGGTTTLNSSGGTLRLGNTSALPSTSPGPLSMAANTTLDLNGFDAKVTDITSSVATSTITDNAAGSGTTTLNVTSNNTQISCLVNDGATRKVSVRVRNSNFVTAIFNPTSANTFSGGLILANGSGSGTRYWNTNSNTNVTPYGAGTITIGEAATDNAAWGFSIAAANNNTTVANNFIVNTALGTDVTGSIRCDATNVTLSGTITAALADVKIRNAAGTGTINLTGQITGTFGLDLNAAITATLNNAGTANDYAGTTTIESGTTLVLGRASQIPDGAGKGDVVVAGTFKLGGFSETINGLSGAGTVDGISGTPTLTLGNNDVSATFSGVIQNTAGTLALTKMGTGTQTLSGTNTYSGATTISGGTLLVTGAIGASSAVSVANSATLGGTGTVAGAINLSAGSTLAPGISGTTIGTLTTGAVTMNSASIFRVDLDGTTPSADQISTTSTVACAGTLTIASSLNSAVGKVYTLITATGGVSGTFTGLANNAFITQGGRGYQVNYTATTVTLTDVAPQITARQTLDTNSNGQIDLIRLTFSQALNDTTSGLTVAVSGYTVTGFATGTANDTVLDVVLAESGTPDTGATPNVQITANSTLASFVSGTLVATEGTATAATDAAAPVLISAAWTDGDSNGVDAGDTLALTFSEAVTSSGMVIADLGLPVTNDTLDTSTIANQTGTSITVALAGTLRLSPGGTYASTVTTAGTASGIYLATTTAVTDAVGLSPAVGSASSAKDIASVANAVAVMWSATSNALARNWALGTVAIGDPRNTVDDGLNLGIANIGDLTCDLQLKVAASTPSGWSPAASAGLNAFLVKARNGTPASATVAGNYPLTLTTTDQDLANGLYSGRTTPLHLFFQGPTALTVGGGTAQTIVVTLTARVPP